LSGLSVRSNRPSSIARISARIAIIASMKAIELRFGFAFGRLDHQRTGDGEAHRRRMEIRSRSAASRRPPPRSPMSFLSGRKSEDAFVRERDRRDPVEHRIMRRESSRQCIRREDRRLRSRSTRPVPPIIATYIHEIGRIEARPVRRCAHRPMALAPGSADSDGPAGNGARCACTRPGRRPDRRRRAECRTSCAG
jgi:hypothetical protein